MGCTEDIIRKGPESVWLHIKNSDNSITKIGCVYRSPNATQLENEGLNEIFESFENVNDDTLVVGDFNYPNINWENNVSLKDDDSATMKFLNAVNNGLMLQHIP